MILSETLKSLSGNQQVNITLADPNNDSLITFNAGGYAAVDDELGKRTVRRIRINTAQSVTILVDEVQPEEEAVPENTEPTTEPENTEPVEP